MKRIIALIIVLVLCGAALAEGIDWSKMTDEQINTEIANAQAELEKRGGGTESVKVEEGTPTLQKGSKGDDVKKLQQRLKDLNYLSGGPKGLTSCRNLPLDGACQAPLHAYSARRNVF